MKKPEKILWAMDVDGDPETQNQVARALRPLLAATHSPVQPIFVLSPRTGLSKSVLPSWEKPFLGIAESRLEGLVSRCELPGVLKPVILVNREPSIRKSTDMLVGYAENNGFDLIVTGTHARKGPVRAFLGSFAETLLLHSTVPVLTVNPSAKPGASISRILFPSDFGQPSRRCYEATVELAKSLGAAVWLYNKAPDPVTVPVPEANILYEYLATTQEQLAATAKAWAEWGTKRGVEVQVAIDGKPGSAADSIVEFAKAEKIDLIAMVAQSGPLESVLLGSVARQVVRNAECPVWIQHAREE